ncbi:hypothetical protein T310_5294 [Rasamsonia emersonii CBS 393.64]|uniref:Uncharacterized protein n=1 Tax=Rasamsonia emersonii (strain ATCC 16479 / CBS 393.64 / IMI 116815) TaxID=1408163 RepID=A0A0F4YST2_RASE3|nr:hypothetical protein T310_5294 [Rasamsonia emersonii CBS 393.64]KKA20678.1 hypothetical protein T310_5294 [Rasamsonia emersonii CBS 393.64]
MSKDDSDEIHGYETHPWNTPMNASRAAADEKKETCTETGQNGFYFYRKSNLQSVKASPMTLIVRRATGQEERTSVVGSLSGVCQDANNLTLGTNLYRRDSTVSIASPSPSPASDQTLSIQSQTKRIPGLVASTFPAKKELCSCLFEHRTQPRG